MVIQRQKRKDSQNDIFEGEDTYRCIVTNGHDSTEKEIIIVYNARGASERTFDKMNNDFGWKHLHCSFLKENTIFLLLTSIAGNFYDYLVNKIAKVFKDVAPGVVLKSLCSALLQYRLSGVNRKEVGACILFPQAL